MSISNFLKKGEGEKDPSSQDIASNGQISEDSEMSDIVIAGFAEALLNEPTRVGALLVLGGFGKRAIKCVPLILGVMKINDPLTKLECANALKAITGENFGEDPEAWERWWDDQELK